MYEKIKKFFKKFWKLIVGVLAAVVFFMLGRRSANGSGVQPIDDELRRSKEDTERAEESNNKIGERLDESTRRAEELGKRLDECKEGAAGIKQNNQGIEERLDQSIDILKQAKERSQKGKV